MTITTNDVLFFKFNNMELNDATMEYFSSMLKDATGCGTICMGKEVELHVIKDANKKESKRIMYINSTFDYIHILCEEISEEIGDKLGSNIFYEYQIDKSEGYDNEFAALEIKRLFNLLQIDYIVMGNHGIELSLCYLLAQTTQDSQYGITHQAYDSFNDDEISKKCENEENKITVVYIDNKIDEKKFRNREGK